MNRNQASISRAVAVGLVLRLVGCSADAAPSEPSSPAAEASESQPAADVVTDVKHRELPLDQPFSGRVRTTYHVV